MTPQKTSMQTWSRPLYGWELPGRWVARLRSCFRVSWRAASRQRPKVATNGMLAGYSWLCDAPRASVWARSPTSLERTGQHTCSCCSSSGQPKGVGRYPGCATPPPFVPALLISSQAPKPAEGPRATRKGDEKKQVSVTSRGIYFPLNCSFGTLYRPHVRTQQLVLFLIRRSVRLRDQMMENVGG